MLDIEKVIRYLKMHAVIHSKHSTKIFKREEQESEFEGRFKLQFLTKVAPYSILLFISYPVPNSTGGFSSLCNSTM